ncbi:phospholipid/cholesterol/gamma-HCH transport system substrate-binding protein [Halopseudomonas litoralis]|uniref:Phospholipid/cholesterol/gamma-HCH transport system substrate-binding protein n=1 Tax=Halopseudomonas litoralis TaxID=797277 RepID=A0A1H1UFK8_9GAMM|nr:MlaD family protein [Halopseudomonas litoralis]SDS71287.1 phospholipid/cholesterol/gamma-HCH transport system substrate-binding protein [Halopseudomonas litoralis]
METRAHHVIIGLFTLLAGAGAIFFAIWISDANTSKDYRRYTVVFREAVTGLSRGSAVQYSGIPVGDITELTLDPSDPRQVLARIRVSDSAPVTKDTKARLTFTGITGNSVIELVPGDPQSPPLESTEGKAPRIYSVPSPISSLLANGEDLMTNINQLVISARNMLSDENADRIASTLESIETAAGSLSSQGDDVKALVGELTLASQQASELMGSINSLVNDQGSQTLNSAEQTLESIARASETLENMLQDNSEAFTNGMQGLGQLEPAINELRGSLGALRSITRRLEDNPARFLMGRDTFEEYEP